MISASVSNRSLANFDNLLLASLLVKNIALPLDQDNSPFPRPILDPSQYLWRQRLDGRTADSRSKAKLIQAIATPSSYPAFHQLVALLNFPGKDTESILQNFASGRDGSNMLLEHLRYTKNPANPLDNMLLGKWRLEGRNETVQLNFKSDHSCSVDVRMTEVTRDNKNYSATDGKGHWAVHEGKLWISRTHIRENSKWRKGTRQFFAPKRIRLISPDEVKLEGGPPMKRAESFATP